MATKDLYIVGRATPEWGNPLGNNDAGEYFPVGMATTKQFGFAGWFIPLEVPPVTAHNMFFIDNLRHIVVQYGLISAVPSIWVDVGINGGDHRLAVLDVSALLAHDVPFFVAAIYDGYGASDPDRVRMWLNAVEMTSSLTYVSPPIPTSAVNPTGRQFQVGAYGGLGWLGYHGQPRFFWGDEVSQDNPGLFDQAEVDIMYDGGLGQPDSLTGTPGFESMIVEYLLKEQAGFGGTLLENTGVGDPSYRGNFPLGNIGWAGIRKLYVPEPPIRAVNRIPYPYDLDNSYSILERLRFSVRAGGGLLSQLSSVQLRAGWTRCVWSGGENAPQDFPENTIPADPQDPFAASFRGFNDLEGDIAYSGITAESTRGFFPLGLAPHDPLLLERPADGVADRLGFYFMSNELFPGERAVSQVMSIITQATPAVTVPSGYLYPNAVANGFNGVLFGSIYGLTGQALYVGFEEPAPGIYNLRVMGPPDWAGNRSPNLLVTPVGDPVELWEPSELYAFQILWDPIKGTVDVFGSGSLGIESDQSIRIASVPLEDVNSIRPGIRVGGVQYDEPVPRLTTIFGTDGTAISDTTLMLSMSAASIVKGMVLNGGAMGGIPYFRSENASVVMNPTALPEKLDIPWLRPSDERLPEFDSAYSGTEGPSSIDGATGELVLTKTDPAEHNVFFRQEHSIGVSTAMTGEVEFVAHAVDAVHGGLGVANMGFRIVFSDRYLNFQFLGVGSNRSVGVLDSAGSPLSVTSYSTSLVDWSVEHHYRVTLNSTTGKVEVYIDQEYDPSIEVNTVDLPATIAPYWPDTVIGFGHLDVIATSGELRVKRFSYSFVGIHYEAKELALPGAWTLLGTGAVPAIVGDRLEIEDVGYGTSPDYSVYKHDLVNFGVIDGVTLDFKMSITDWTDPGGAVHGGDAIVPAGIALYNGTNWLYLMFVTNALHGKFLVVPGFDLDDDLIKAQAHNERGREISAQVDWTEEHEYRLVWNANGIDVFVDDMLVPVLSLPVSHRLPIQSFFTYVGLQAAFFGSFDPDTATTSLWRSIRVHQSDGIDFAVTPGSFTPDELERVAGGRGIVTIESESI